MGILKTFALGGVHPKENKLSSGAPIEQVAVPEQVIVPLGQNLGAPSKTVVKKGDKVKVGQLIAEAGGFISTNIHSPVSGTVMKIDAAIDPTGFKRPCVVIKVEGDEWEEHIDRSEDLVTDINFSAEEIIVKYNCFIGSHSDSGPEVMICIGK